MVVAALVLAALAWAGLALRAHWIGVGADGVQDRWNAQIRADQAEALRRQQLAARDQLTRFTNAERNADEQAKREAATAGRIAQLDRTVDGLRDALGAIARRPVPAADDAAGLVALIGEATTTRELFGACAARYRDVAAAAAELADQVTGLQADAQTVCRAGSTPLSSSSPVPAQ